MELDDDILEKCINSEKEYVNLVLKILQGDDSPLSQKLYNRLKNDLYDEKTDILIKEISKNDNYPYNLMMPHFRELVGLSINSDENCIQALNRFKGILNENNDKEVINTIIEFVKGNEIEIDVNPSFELLLLIDKIPFKKIPKFHQLCEYLSQIE